VLKKLLTVRNLVILLAIVALFVVSSLLGLKVPSPVVSLAAEPIFHIGPLTITNSLFTAWIIMILLIVLALLTTRRMPKDLARAGDQELVPSSGLQNFMEMIVEALYNMTQSIGGRWTPKFFPIVATIFIFVLTSNWLGLVPGFGSIGILEHPHVAGQTGFVANGPILTGIPATATESHSETSAKPEAQDEHAAAEKHADGYIVVPFFRPPSTDLNFTLALGLMVVVLSQYFGVKALGPGYFRKFFDTSGFKQGAFNGAVGIFVSILELISEIARVLSFGFRLFGNIFAGEVLLGVMAFLIPYIASLPFYGLEVFVGFIQAAVFMMLALVFFVMATVGHGHEEHH